MSFALAILLALSQAVLPFPGPIQLASGGGTATCVQGGTGCTHTTSNSTTAASTAGPYTWTLPSGINITAGNSFVIVLTTNYSITSITNVADTETYTEEFSKTLTGNYVSGYCVNSSIGGYDQLVITTTSATGNYIQVDGFEVHGSGCEAVASATGNSTAISSGASGTPTGNDFFVGIGTNASSATETLNWSGAANQGCGAYQSCYATITANIAQTAAWTLGSTESWGAGVIGVKP